jgi:hypothetical protein
MPNLRMTDTGGGGTKPKLPDIKPKLSVNPADLISSGSPRLPSLSPYFVYSQITGEQPKSRPRMSPSYTAQNRSNLSRHFGGYEAMPESDRMGQFQEVLRNILNYTTSMHDRPALGVGSPEYTYTGPRDISKSYEGPAADIGRSEEAIAFAQFLQDLMNANSVELRQGVPREEEVEIDGEFVEQEKEPIDVPLDPWIRMWFQNQGYDELPPEEEEKYYGYGGWGGGWGGFMPQFSKGGGGYYGPSTNWRIRI